MTLEEIEEKIEKLDRRLNGYVDEKGNKHPGINGWIKANPQVTDPNAYEIMDCNVEYAELLAELKAYYDKNGYPQIVVGGEARTATARDLPILHQVLGACFLGLIEMDGLRHIDTHPFFTEEEPNALYCAVKLSQLNCNYVLPTDPDMRRIKREVLCKAMSVPFYIWQVHRTEPDYRYDNRDEFEGMQTALALYQATETPCQFEEQVQALHNKIDANYKFSTPKVASTTQAK